MLINFPPLKREGLIREGGGGLIEDLRYIDFGNELYLRFAGKSLVDILRKERGHVRLDPVASINMVRNVL